MLSEVVGGEALLIELFLSARVLRIAGKIFASLIPPLETLRVER